MKAPPSVGNLRAAYADLHAFDLFKGHPTVRWDVVNGMGFDAFCCGVKWLWKQEHPAGVCDSPSDEE